MVVVSDPPRPGINIFKQQPLTNGDPAKREFGSPGRCQRVTAATPDSSHGERTLPFLQFPFLVVALFSRATGTRLFYMAVVQVFEESNLGLAELSLVLFPKINFNTEGI